MSGSGGGTGAGLTPLNMAIARVMTRAYARVVAGHQQLARWNATSYAYTVQHQTSVEVTNTTSLIFLNEEKHYASGFHAVVFSEPSTGVAVAWSKISRNHLKVEHTYTAGGGGFVAAVISVMITQNGTLHTNNGTNERTNEN